MNLRNIIWHGFARSHTIPNYYASTLLFTLHSLGAILKEKSVAGFQLQYKPLIRDLNEFLQPMLSNHLWTNCESEEFQTLLKNCQNALLKGQQELCIDENSKPSSDFIDDYITIWLKLFQLYKQRRYIRFVVLIIPEIELLLRCYYGQLNGVEIMAKLNEYYVIIDTIFSDQVPDYLLKNITDNSINELLNFHQNDGKTVSEGCFKILYDLFLDSEGCRLRDRVSHGEFDFLSLDNSKLASILMHLFIVLLKFTFAENICFDCVESYESVYHLNCRTKNQLIAAYKEFYRFKELRLQVKLDADIYFDKRLMRSLKIFSRPKKEFELMTLIEKIGTCLQQTLINYSNTLKERLRMLELRELHSRNRKSLSNLLTALPKIWENLIQIWESIAATFLLLQDDAFFQPENEMTLEKFLR